MSRSNTKTSALAAATVLALLSVASWQAAAQDSSPAPVPSGPPASQHGDTDAVLPITLPEEMKTPPEIIMGPKEEKPKCKDDKSGTC